MAQPQKVGPKELSWPEGTEEGKFLSHHVIPIRGQCERVGSGLGAA